MMSARLHLLACFCAALWFGSMGVTGFVAVPILFANLQPVAAAGAIAAKLFAAQGWVCIGSAAMLLICFRGSLHQVAQQQYDASGQPIGRDHSHTPDTLLLAAILAGLLLALLLQFGISPRIQSRENPGLWHSLGTTVYSLQWACAACCVWRLVRHRG